MNEIYFTSNGNKIYSFLNSNTKLKENKHPPIIFLLTGDGEKGLNSSTWPPLIKSFENSGFWIYGFDFNSQGKSEGERQFLNLKTGTDDFIEAIKKLSKVVKNIKRHKLFFFGSSFGASVLCNALPQIKQINGIILKSPGIYLYEAYENEVGGSQGLSQWKKLNANPESGINFEAYKYSLKANLFLNISNFDKPALIVFGNKDNIIPLNHIERLKYLEKINFSFHELDGVDHSYKQPGAINELIKVSINFLKEQSNL